MSTLRTTHTSLRSTTASFDYDASGIEPSLQVKLERAAASIFDLGRRTTEQTFELGDHLNAASALLPEGAFDPWVKQRCGLAARSARNYMSVFRNLEAYRDDLVDLSVSATVLFHLSSATPDQIDEAMKFAADNGRLQVSDVKAILGGGDDGEGKAARPDQFAAGGITGLKALMAIKARDGAKLYVAHVEAIVKAILDALGKKRIMKDELSKMIQNLSRTARLELESLALFVDADLAFGRSPRPMSFPETSAWSRVNDMLVVLGRSDAWPKQVKLRNWLEAEVLPILDWSISKKRKPEWPLVGPATETAATEHAVVSDSDDEAEVPALESFETLKAHAVVPSQVAKVLPFAADDQAAETPVDELDEPDHTSRSLAMA